MSSAWFRVALASVLLLVVCIAALAWSSWWEQRRADTRQAARWSACYREKTARGIEAVQAIDECTLQYGPAR